MWETLNQALFIAEIVLAVVGVMFVWGKKNAIRTFVYLAFVFVLNSMLYTVPALYEELVLGEGRHPLFYAMDIIPAAIKAFVGDGATGMVEGYSSVFPVYAYIYAIGLALGVVSTYFAAISAFGRRILNVFKVARMLNSSSCDIISGNSPEALGYAKSYANTIIALSKGTDKSVVNDLVNSGYTVVKRSLSKEFFDSRFFNSSTRYNVVLPNDDGDHYDKITDALSYLNASAKSRNIHFYIETDEEAMPTEKNYIDTVAKEHRADITLFSRNELIARTFVDENPITADMPTCFFDADTSVMADTELNVFMLGFGKLSREIYRQFVVNNQLCTFDGKEYRAHPVNYILCDSKINKRAWDINGLSDAMDKLVRDEYFPLPDMPYSTECIDETLYEMDYLGVIAERIKKENAFSYVVIDTSDVYRNIDTAERLNLLLDGSNNFRVFIYNNSEISVYGNINCYGSIQSLYTHDVIVNEKLTALAKSINTFYSGADTWGELSYFDMYSNIALAGNLRLKLNLLGLDYSKDGKGEGYALLENALEKIDLDQTCYDHYFDRGVKTSLLAQEHFRWNAYHMMSGYLPMKKSEISVEADDSGKIKKTVKNNHLKRHGCLTTYNGIDSLSEHLAEKSNDIAKDNTYTSADFDYYKYDGLLLRAMPEFFKENKFSITKR